MRATLISRRRGFTLVEILIVVVILGILAAIVVPQFANSAASSAAVALKDDLRTMRNAVQLYQAQHGGYPTLASFEAQMTQFSDVAGGTSVTKTSTHVLGPYLLTMPALPVGAERGKTAVTSTTFATGFGWQYDASTGQVLANAASTEVDSDGTAYLSY